MEAYTPNFHRKISRWQSDRFLTHSVKAVNIWRFPYLGRPAKIRPSLWAQSSGSIDAPAWHSGAEKTKVQGDNSFQSLASSSGQQAESAVLGISHFRA
jgi:hypothetical protein